MSRCDQGVKLNIKVGKYHVLPLVLFPSDDGIKVEAGKLRETEMLNKFVFGCTERFLQFGDSLDIELSLIEMVNREFEAEKEKHEEQMERLGHFVESPFVAPKTEEPTI